MSGDRSLHFVGPRGGQLIFALAFLAVSVLLLSQIGTQTVRAEGAAFFAQPRFWPGLALAGMVGFGALHLWRLPWRQLTGADWRELRDWARALEFAAWFMAYVLLVPVLGYLPATLIFVPSLSWRMGYRSARMLGIGVLFAVLVVVTFKMVLSVKIPGGALYEHLPEALRGFFILNL